MMHPLFKTVFLQLCRENFLDLLQHSYIKQSTEEKVKENHYINLRTEKLNIVK